MHCQCGKCSACIEAAILYWNRKVEMYEGYLLHAQAMVEKFLRKQKENE